MEATELFDLCALLAKEGPSEGGTHRLHELLVLAAAEGCRRQQDGAFGNLFSQVDFLCKHHHLSPYEQQEVQTMRRHSNQWQALEADEWNYDLRALTYFISTVLQTDVPGDLRRLLPSQGRPHTDHLLSGQRYVRCIVNTWSSQLIEATSETEERLLIDYATTEGGRDFGYLQRLLRPGMQLNLLDCHVTDTVPHHMVPGLIVVEPDFLIDISAIAACFTDYGHHPLLYTVGQLKPRPNTQAILLGNFAGAALDDLIHHQEVSMSHTLRRSFREQALRFAACDSFDAQQFKDCARQQVDHLREATTMLFGQDSSSTPPPFHRQHALLEPSFVCERLGLQGRVDLMTTDMRLLVEQKSGRNPKIEHHSHDPHGLQIESHYVQLLLYYGVLHYNFGKSTHHVSTRLLYSRYPAHEGLLTVGYYGQLFREAIRLRNQIVSTQYFIARQGFGALISSLTLDTIYQGVKQDSFFNRYVAPDMATLTHQLTTLPPLERAYYERMLTFVYQEQLCQKVGVQEGVSSCGADLWQMPLSMKMETGSIYTHLTIMSRRRSHPASGYDLITLTMAPDTDAAVKNFRPGDMVYLYAHHGQEEPCVCRSILYKGTLLSIAQQQVVVLLANGQQHIGEQEQGDCWVIEHAVSDTTTHSHVKSLHQFITAAPERKALLLGQRPPEADLSIGRAQAYHPNYDEVLLRIRQARDYFLLVGPPGSGKTSMALRFMVEDELHHTPAPSILLTAYTNRAVDEICGMLTQASLPYLRLGNEASCHARYRNHLLEQTLPPQATLEDIRHSILSTPIIVGTTSMLLSRPFLFDLKTFSLAIVDEASQILEPAIIGLLASPQIGRFVLIGDHKQLPAVVQQSEAQSRVSQPLLQAIGLTDCRRSLFERLLQWEHHQGRTRFVGILRRQGRMHPEVAAFPHRLFYAREQLDCVPVPHQLLPSLSYSLPSQDALDGLLKEHRVLFFDTETWQAPLSSDQANSSDKVNPREARLVARLLQRIHRFYGQHFQPDTTVGVIVPYRNQIAMVRQEIERLAVPELLHISIDTVERYQGSQREVIIYAFTISYAYQIDFLTANSFTDIDGSIIDRKLNVALTRARQQMLITGKAALLSRNPIFAQLIEQYAATPT